MSVIVKNMKMPKCCGECPFYYENKHDRGDDSFCLASGKEAKCGCPLIELPPQGDLIDRDEGIKIGAELAVMHGSDATTQELEKEYWRGYEDAMQRRDVKPVVHSKWSDEMVACRDEYGDFHFGYQCSACGAILNRTNYCGSCGAKMDL